MFGVWESLHGLLSIRNFQIWIWGLVRPKSSLPSSKTDQNELRRLNQASIDGLRCLGVPSDPPIDISCTWTRSELFGMENLAVTFVTSDFIYHEVKNFEN